MNKKDFTEYLNEFITRNDNDIAFPKGWAMFEALKQGYNLDEKLRNKITKNVIAKLDAENIGVFGELKDETIANILNVAQLDQVVGNWLDK